MTNTREKLLEAEYFLDRIIEEQSKRDFFQYNLSAFLSAARSITYFMQNEYCKTKGFDMWYANKQAHVLADKTMKFLNNKRVMTIHQKPVKPAAHVTVTASAKIGINVSASAIVTRADGTIEKLGSEGKSKPTSTPAKTEATIEWQWYFHELKGKDVVTICREYLDKLETLVEECESRFA